jgi:chaperonin GroES
VFAPLSAFAPLSKARRIILIEHHINRTLSARQVPSHFFTMRFGTNHAYGVLYHIHRFDCRLLMEVAVKIRPLHDRVLVKRLAAQDKTSGGLFIPDTAKEKPLEALVISVGNGKVLESGEIQALSVKAGDKVLIGKYSGSEVTLDGKDHIILREDDILAILEK